MGFVMIGRQCQILLTLLIVSIAVVSATQPDSALEETHESQKVEDKVRVSRDILDTEYREPEDFSEGSQYLDNLQGEEKRANSMMHFGKKANSMMHFGKKANSMIHFGKRANQLLHFGKRLNNMMHFGKRPSPNSMMHFGKRPAMNSMVHFGKRANSMMHFGKRANSMMHFGKRANSMMHFGKRPSPNQMMHFGKRPALNNMVHFGKRAPKNALVHFGKRSVDENELESLKLLNDESADKRAPSTPMLHFGKRNPDTDDLSGDVGVEDEDLYDSYNGMKRNLERTYGLGNFPLKFFGARQVINLDDLSSDDVNRLYDVIYESYLRDKDEEEDEVEEEALENMMDESKRSTSKKMDLYNRQAKNAMIHFG